MRGARSIVFLEVDLSAKAPDGRLSNRAECRCFASGREAHSSAATTFGRASPSAVAEQANSALEPTALRAAAQHPSRSASCCREPPIADPRGSHETQAPSRQSHEETSI